MKNRYYGWLFITLSALLMSACGNKEYNEEKNQPERVLSSKNVPGEMRDEAENSSEETGDEQMKELIIEAGGQRFQATLYDNETTQALMERLPMTLNMEELHGNEKFYYLDEGLPANSERTDHIRTGDIMLFGSDCLVLFYDDFSTSYSYTRIGHVEDEEAFADALGSGTVEVSFETGEIR